MRSKHVIQCLKFFIQPGTAAVFSTASAINATLFSTARLMEDVSEKRYLPAILSYENLQKVPDYAVILLGAAGIVLFILT